jgi:hypothetical protein
VLLANVSVILDILVTLAQNQQLVPMIALALACASMDRVSATRAILARIAHVRLLVLSIARILLELPAVCACMDLATVSADMKVIIAEPQLRWLITLQRPTMSPRLLVHMLLLLTTMPLQPTIPSLNCPVRLVNLFCWKSKTPVKLTRIAITMELLMTSLAIVFVPLLILANTANSNARQIAHFTESVRMDCARVLSAGEARVVRPRWQFRMTKTICVRTIAPIMESADLEVVFAFLGGLDPIAPLLLLALVTTSFAVGKEFAKKALAFVMQSFPARIAVMRLL